MKKRFLETEYTNDEMLLLLKKSLFVMIPAFILQIAMFLIDLVFILQDNILPFIFYEFANELVAFSVLILLVIWIHLKKSSLLKMNDNGKFIKIFGVALFYFLTLGLIIEYILLLKTFTTKEEYFLKNANLTSEDLISEKQKYDGFLIAKVVILAINTLLFGYILRNVKVTNFSFHSLNYLLNALVLTNGIGFIIFYYIHRVSLSFLIDFLESAFYFNEMQMNFLKILSFCSLPILAFAFFTSLIRYKIFYLAIGSITMIFSLILLNGGSYVIRKSANLNEHYNSNCLKLLSFSHKDYLAELGANKYLETNECSKDELIVRWEDDMNVSSPKNNLGCLNKNSCGFLIQSYVNRFKEMGIAILFNGIMQFVISAFLFFLSDKCCLEIRILNNDTPKWHENLFSFGRKFFIELGIFFFLIVFIISSLVYFEYTTFPINKEDTLYKFNANPNNYKNDFTSLIESNRKNRCSSLKEVINKDELKKILQEFDEKAKVRIALLSLNSNFITSENFHQYNIQMFNFKNEETKQKIFQLKENNKNTDFKVFQGKKLDAERFMNEGMKICCFPEVNCKINYKVFSVSASSKINSQRILENNDNVPKSSDIIHKNINIFQHLSVPIINAKAQGILDSYSFTNFKITIFDSETRKIIPYVTIYILNGRNQNCRLHFKSQNKLAQSLVTNKEGYLILNNLIEKNFIIFVRKNGYKNNCWNYFPDFINKEINIIMIRKFYDNGMKIFLFYKFDAKNNFFLQTTYDNKEKKNCFSGSTINSCENIEFKNETILLNRIGYQSLDILKIYDTNYLIFAADFAAKIKGIDLLKAESFIQVYSSESDFPLSNYVIPSMNENSKIWLAICIIKKENNLLLREVNKYFEIEETKVLNFPDSSLCDNL